jgi:hypothetical protein
VRVYWLVLLLNPPFFFFLKTEVLGYYYVLVCALMLPSMVLSYIGNLASARLTERDVLSSSRVPSGQRLNPRVLGALKYLIVLNLTASVCYAIYRENESKLILIDLLSVVMPITLYGLLHLKSHERSMLRILQAVMLSEILKLVCTYIGSQLPVLQDHLMLPSQGGMRYIDLLLPFGVVASMHLMMKRPSLLPFLSVAALVLASILSLSRGIWLAEAAAIAMMTVRTKRVGGLLVMLVLVWFIASKFVGTQYDVIERAQYTMQQVGADEGSASSRRLDEFYWVFEEMSGNWLAYLIGHGPGATYLGVTGYSSETYWFGERHYIHNQFLSLTFRFGLTGCVLLAAPLILACVNASRQRTGDVVIPYIIAGASLSMTAAMMYTLPYSIPFFSILKMLYQAENDIDRPRGELQHA